MSDTEPTEGDPADAIVWEDPPPKYVRDTWALRLKPLQEHPGRWAKFGPYARSSVSALARRCAERNPQYEFDIGYINKQGFVYARFPEEPTE